MSTILDILGKARSDWNCAGADKLKEWNKRATFVRVTQQLNGVFGK